LFLCSPKFYFMRPFPVISSTLSANHLAIFLRDRYNLSANTTCKLLKTGINHSYLVSDGVQEFVFRVYSLDWRSETEINEEIRLLNLLRDGGVSVSYPLKDAGDNYIQQIDAPEGMRLGVMFSFAEGEKLLNLSGEQHYKIGETMARIHSLTQDLQMQRVHYTPEVVLQHPFQYLDSFLPAESDEMAWLLSAQKHLLNEVANADETQMRKGAVHLDIWFDNMNITKEGLVTIFDFDFCGNGWLAYDIAYNILQIHSTEKDVTERELKKKSFLEGYESVTTISAEEKRLLPVLGVSLYFFYLGIQAQRFDNWSNVFFNETYLKRFINLLVKKFFEENVSAELLAK
jgi:Ser/Thr protein kinase RdoA (MazF antagonist)